MKEYVYNSCEPCKILNEKFPHLNRKIGITVSGGETKEICMHDVELRSMSGVDWSPSSECESSIIETTETLVANLVAIINELESHKARLCSQIEERKAYQHATQQSAAPDRLQPVLFQ